MEFENHKKIIAMARQGATCIGKRLSRLLVHFFFIEARNDEQLIEIFGLFSASLEARIKTIKGNKTYVIDKILDLIETGERLIKESLKFKKRKRSEKPVGLKRTEMMEWFYMEITLLEDLFITIRMKQKLEYCDEDRLNRGLHGRQRQVNAIQRNIDIVAMPIDTSEDLIRKYIKNYMVAKSQAMWMRSC